MPCWPCPAGRALLAAPFAGALATPALAQPAWPSRPVKLIRPFPPGGSTDAVGRTIGQAIAAAIPQPVVADNLGGAGGQIGVEAPEFPEFLATDFRRWGAVAKQAGIRLD